MITASRFMPSYFYPRPPCGGRLGGGDQGFCPARNFYPRPPCGGRRLEQCALLAEQHISIHVPLAGDDMPPTCTRYRRKSFLSTSPLRGTTYLIVRNADFIKFLSTSPLRGTTLRRENHLVRDALHFYPRPPCGGRRGGGFKPPFVGLHFYPRPPCGGRPMFSAISRMEDSISIHVPLAGDDALGDGIGGVPLHFYPRPPCGGRRLKSGERATQLHFYPRPPCGGRLQYG